MLFNSIDFLIFFPIVLLINFIMPKKVRYIWLLFSSYYFYMCWNAKYILLILMSTVVTYICGILLEKVKCSDYEPVRIHHLKNLIVIIGLIINLGSLFYFKYINFAASIFSWLFTKCHIVINIPQFDIVLPVGISFFTFQALGYMIDVYKGDIYAETNFFRYALFVSFFPQLVAGPIERSKNLLRQLSIAKGFDFEKAREGLLLMLWGYFLKIVLADRIALFVDIIYGDYESYPGVYLIVATVLFTVQLYCDFAGYSIIAMGAAKMLGIQLMDNFKAPYIAFSVADFWRRWHISLTSWFRDYLYIPLGGSKRGKLRKYRNIMIVFLTSGLWHGASLGYVVWGGINGLYQVLGDLLKPIRIKLCKIFKLNRESFGHKCVLLIGTFTLVDISFVFFRAGELSKALSIFKSILRVHNVWILFDQSLYGCGLDVKNFNLMLVGILILIFADICKYRGIKLREIIICQDYWFRWIVIAFSIGFILLFGMWGPSFDNANFIYFQF